MLLSVTNLDVRYGGIRALQSVSLHINRGEIVTLIGSNGAGKTTLLRSISGLLRPADGSICWESSVAAREMSAVAADSEGNRAEFASRETIRTGTELIGLAPHEIVALGVSHVPEGRQIFAPLTV